MKWSVQKMITQTIFTMFQDVKSWLKWAQKQACLHRPEMCLSLILPRPASAIDSRTIVMPNITYQQHAFPMQYRTAVLCNIELLCLKHIFRMHDMSMTCLVWSLIKTLLPSQHKHVGALSKLLINLHAHEGHGMSILMHVLYRHDAW